ncbi:MAG: hypothetical protein WDA68_07005 [Phycisphaerae bacterium]
MLIKNISRLNRSSQNALFAALIIIAAVAMHRWIFSPHITYLYAAQQYDVSVSKLVERNKVISREVESRTKRLNNLSEEYTSAMKLVFTPEEAKVFFGNLQSILEKTGCAVHTLNLVGTRTNRRNTKTQEDTGVIENNAILSISGQYDSIIRLVEGLQNHSPKIWMDSFKLELIEPLTGRLKCDMTIVIYTVQDKETAI